MSEKVLLAYTGEHETAQLVAVFTDEILANQWLKTAEDAYAITHTSEEYGKVERDGVEITVYEMLFLRELPLNPSQCGGWRYWIIEGEKDTASFWYDMLPTDSAWPSYSMTTWSDAGTIICGACGLGWTMEEAKAAAQKHIKEFPPVPREND